MTTYQEPPLQSRRAARAGERAEAPPETNSDPNAETVTPPPSSNAEPLNAEPLSYATSSRPPLPQYDGQSLRPRRGADETENAEQTTSEVSSVSESDAHAYRPTDFSPDGRAAAAHAHALPAGFERTITRRELRALREGISLTPPATNQTPIVEPSSRDASAPASVDVPPFASSPVEASQQPEVAETLPDESSEPVDSASVASAPVSPPPATSPPAASPPATSPVAASFTVAAPPAEWPTAAVVPTPDPVPLVSPPPLIAPAPQSSSRLNSALAEFDALAAGREISVPDPDAEAPQPGRRAAQPAVTDEASVALPPVVAAPLIEPLAPAVEAVTLEPLEPLEAEQPSGEPSQGLSAFDALFTAPQTPVMAPPSPLLAQPPVESTVEPTAAEPEAAQPEEPEAPAPEAPAPDPLLSAPAPQGAPAVVLPSSAYPAPVDLPAPPPTGSPASFAAAPAPSSGASPVGHWSTQSDLDDAEQVNESTISRSVGTGHGAITTSALVLPTSPEHSIAGPVGAGGEILLTGSISLPHSLSATGAHPSQLDQSDLDHALDPGDHQVLNTDSTPVRAIRAVSTHTATGGIIAPRKPSGTRGFTILIIAAAAMAAVVVGLLVVGFVSGTI